MLIKTRFLKKQKSIKTRFFLQSLVTNCLLIFIPILVIGPYSLFQSAHDNTKSIEKSTYQTLRQLDATMDSLYSHIDNANIFFASNPRVTVQLKKAFHEKSLSLNSLKNVENLSLYFQNLLFTNHYIRNIYVYYDNDYNRLYLPQKGAVQSVAGLKDSPLIRSYETSGDTDFWLETYEKKDAYSSVSTDSLMIFQRLYTRSTSSPTGVIVFEYNLNKLKEYFESLIQYEDQTIYLVRPDGTVVYTNRASDDPACSPAAIFSQLKEVKKQQLYTVRINQASYKAAYLSSPRTNGLTYLTLTPSSEIYETTKSILKTYFILIFFALAASFALAFYKTNREYSYLNSIIDLFASPEASIQHFDHLPRNASNPFEYIMMNLIGLFLKQDYLKIQASEREYKMQLLKMQALQHQINPHFLHNTLNSLYWETIRLTSSENTCSIMVSNLSSIMRYSLSDPQEDVKIQEEAGYLRTYLDIMKNRYPDKFKVEFRIDPDCQVCAIKKMILQPLAENAIYHGIKEKSGPGVICIGARRLKNKVLVFVADNGAGITPDKQKTLRDKLEREEEISTEHIGLVNTNLRLKLSYGKKSALRFKSLKGRFTVVYFFIPLPEQEAYKNS